MADHAQASHWYVLPSLPPKPADVFAYPIDVKARYWFLARARTGLHYNDGAICAGGGRTRPLGDKVIGRFTKRQLKVVTWINRA
jgi:hypothetical protein